MGTNNTCLYTGRQGTLPTRSIRIFFQTKKTSLSGYLYVLKMVFIVFVYVIIYLLNNNIDFDNDSDVDE